MVEHFGNMSGKVHEVAWNFHEIAFALMWGHLTKGVHDLVLASWLSNSLGRWVLMVTFCDYDTPLLLGYETYISTRWLANPSLGDSNFPHKFMELIWIPHSLSKWRFISSLNGHIYSPIMLTMKPRMIIMCWAHSSISFRYASFWYPLLEPHLTTYHSNIGE